MALTHTKGLEEFSEGHRSRGRKLSSAPGHGRIANIKAEMEVGQSPRRKVPEARGEVLGTRQLSTQRRDMMTS